MKKIYFDYAATAPVAPSVFRAMRPYFSNKFGNPGSLHSFGQEAMTAIDESREKIAKEISRPPSAHSGGGGFREIIFTGSATEANNLALRGIVNIFKETSSKQLAFVPKIIVSSIEHESILETCRDLGKKGTEIIYLPVDKNGVVNLKKLKNSLDERTILISVMYANNEIGTIQPIAEISKILQQFKKERNLVIYPLFHTDAAQAFQFLDCDADKLGIDLMTLSAHKIYGPKGIGALFMKHTLQASGFMLHALIAGGGQEFGLRAGTENVSSIVGFAKAVELAVKNREGEKIRTEELKNYFWKKIKNIFPKAEKNNSEKNCLPNIINVYFPGHNSQDLLMKLDLAGIAVSSGAACSARDRKISYVLSSCGFSDKRIKSSLRFSFGKPTTKKEIDEAIKRLKLVLSSSLV